MISDLLENDRLLGGWIDYNEFLKIMILFKTNFFKNYYCLLVFV